MYNNLQLLFEKRGVIFMRILICDDSQDVTVQLKEYIIEYFTCNDLNIPSIQSYNSAESLLHDEGEKDIIFLDIRMPGLNGIYVGQELKKVYPDIIIFIVTSYVEYIDEAMRLHVFRYLLKPIDKQKLFRNIEDAIELYNSSNFKVPIETKEGVYTVRVSQIIVIETQGRITVVHTELGDFISVRNMNYWLNILNLPCFYQTHRSFLVNMKYVANFDHSLVYLSGQQVTAYLTRRKYSSFKEAYLLYLERTR